MLVAPNLIAEAGGRREPDSVSLALPEDMLKRMRQEISRNFFPAYRSYRQREGILEERIQEEWEDQISELDADTDLSNRLLREFRKELGTIPHPQRSGFNDTFGPRSDTGEDAHMEFIPVEVAKTWKNAIQPDSWKREFGQPSSDESQREKRFNQKVTTWLTHDNKGRINGFGKFVKKFIDVHGGGKPEKTLRSDWPSFEDP